LNSSSRKITEDFVSKLDNLNESIENKRGFDIENKRQGFD
jgi:hypothetical protein